MSAAVEIGENLAQECPPHGFLSPRISFSTDFGLPHPDSSPDHQHRQRQRQQQIEWSREFEFSLSIEPNGSPADEIFSDGKLLPLQLLGPSSRIHLVRKLLEQEHAVAAADRSSESPSLALKSPAPPPICSGGAEILHRKNRCFKIIRLLRRSLGDLGKSVDSGPKISTVSFQDSSRTPRVESCNRGVNSGKILWKNLERCSKKNSACPRKNVSVSGESRSSVSGSFSSNVRVAPVLNVPICMGPVKEVGGGGAISGLRKLLLGKNLQRRVTWSCPGGSI